MSHNQFSQKIFALFLAAALTLPFIPLPAKAKTNSTPKTGEAQILVKVRPETGLAEDQATILEYAKKYGKAKAVKKVAHSRKQKTQGIYALQFTESNLASVLASLKNDPNIELAQWNYVYTPDEIPNDPFYSQQYAHGKTGAPVAWDINTGSTDVTIAVIGTGVKWTHEDLATNIWVNTNELADGLDNDSNGYIDDVRGWNFEQANNNPTDDDGHDTAVAGVAAAVGNNGIGVAGVCWYCKIMPLRVDYTSEEVAEAIYYAVDNGAKVINMSFGNYDITKHGPDTIVANALAYADSEMVMAIATAGNDSTNNMRYPGALENVLAVASTDATGNRAGFSNWGDWVDIAAPGSGVMSTTPEGYLAMSGTSFSAPYIAGVAGLMYSRLPSLDTEEARQIIQYTATKLATDKPIPSGQVNAGAAVASDTRPAVFAVIKNPWNDYLISPGTQTIWGTALGSSYKLEYQTEGETSWTEFASGTEAINSMLGTADFAALAPGKTYFNVKLTAAAGAQSDSHTITIGQAAEYMGTFPKALGGGPILSSPTVANLDADAELEIIIGTNQGKIYALNPAGTMLAGWPKTMASPYAYGSPAVGNVDSDPEPEIVATTFGGFATGGHVSVFNADGTMLAGWPKNVGQMRGSAALGNLDADAELEIIVNDSTSSIAKTHAWNSDGTYVTGWPYAHANSNLQTSPALGDVDNNGTLEVVVLDHCAVVVLSSAGTLTQTWPISPCAHSHPVLADLDGNGDLEIAVGTIGWLKVFEHTGTLRWEKATASEPSNLVSAGDITDDSIPEIIYATSSTTANQSTVHAWDAAGQVIPGWPRTAAGQGGAEATIADVTGDHVADVVFPTQAGRVYAWQANGAMADNFPKPSGSPIYRAIALADIDQDGIGEIISGSEDGTLHVWNMSVHFNPNPTDWPMARKDAGNTGAQFEYVAPAPDTTAPSVSVVNPLNNSTVNGIVNIDATATDNVGVTNVEFYLDSTTLLGTDSAAPYALSWNTANASNGSHTITAKAYDLANNSAISTAVTVTVSNDSIAPAVNLTAPAAGAQVSGIVPVSATATDNVGVTKVEFYRDNNVLVGTDTQAPYTVNWDTAGMAVGSHTLYAKAYDAANNSAPSAVRSVTVRDITGPTVSITSPANNALVTKKTTITIQASATDNVGIAKVEFYVSNVLRCTDTASAYTCAWLVPNTTGVTYPITAKAYDAAGNVTTSTTVNVKSR